MKIPALTSTPARLRFFLICILIPALLCVVAGPASGKSKAKEPAPRFNATTTTGEKFNNESTKGKVVLLEFLTTWCGYCLQEAGFVDQINDEYDSKKLIVLAINVAESKKTVKKYLEQHPRKTRIVLTDDTNLAAMFAAKEYPIYVVIDRDGNVAGELRGAAGEKDLRDLLDRG